MLHWTVVERRGSLEGDSFLTVNPKFKLEFTRREVVVSCVPFCQVKAAISCESGRYRPIARGRRGGSRFSDNSRVVEMSS